MPTNFTADQVIAVTTALTYAIAVDCILEEIIYLSGNSNNWCVARAPGKISAQPHTTLCIQFLDRENNDKNNRLPLGKHICFTIVWGCAEILPIMKKNQHVENPFFNDR